MRELLNIDVLAAQARTELAKRARRGQRPVVHHDGVRYHRHPRGSAAVSPGGVCPPRLRPRHPDGRFACYIGAFALMLPAADGVAAGHAAA